MIEVLPTLYGRASNGKIKKWRVQAQGWEGSSTAIIETIHGFLGGAENRNEKKAKGKNIGKSNETEPFEQAVLQAWSLWRKKKDCGYVEDKDNIPMSHEVELFLPMLAHVFEKRRKYISVPAYVQRKLDGARCLARKKDGVVTMWSRKGKILDVPVEIKESLEATLKEGECTDGELYVHGWSFQRIISAVKKYRDDTALLEYHIYDVPVKDVGFEDRFVNGFSANRELPGNIVRVETERVETMEDAIELLETYLQEGYEGLMIRNLHGKYKFKNRSNDLQKMKKFLDSEFEVIGVEEATGRDEGSAVFVCLSDSGKEFNVRPMGTLEQRKEYFDNFEAKYLGKLLTVKYQELSDEGTPRFPVGLHFRPEWDMGE